MTTQPTNARESAIGRLKSRRDFGTHVITYLVFSAAFVAVWYLTGAGYFWPGWIIGLWGAGLLVHAWDVWGRRPISEGDIRREIERETRSHS